MDLVARQPIAGAKAADAREDLVLQAAAAIEFRFVVGQLRQVVAHEGAHG
jgi:hypothetical protein